MLVKGRDLGSPRLPGTVVDLLVVIPMNMIVQGMHIGVLSLCQLSELSKTVPDSE